MSKTSCLILQGKKSFSISKLDQLNRAFNKANGENASISSNEVYLISSQIAIDNQINEISQIVKGSEKLDEFLFLIGPRSGTITPWSSKTGDIFKNVGIQQIDRVERFFGFCISGLEQSIDDLDAFSWILTNVSEINLLHCINFLAADDEISLAKAISTRNPEFLPELPSPAVLASIIIISFCGAISYQRFAAATPV